jgi:SAM-dependent methyltransferase
MVNKAIIQKHFDDYADSWHDRLKQYSYFARREAVRELIKGESFGSVVDIGCGTGDYTALFTGADTRYIGIDISDRMVEVCRRLYPQFSFAVGDGDRTGLDSGSADLVLSIAVLEYYHQPDSHMAELSRIVKEGGSVMVAVPNGENTSRMRDEKILGWLNPIVRWKQRLYPAPRRQSVPEPGRDVVLHKRYSESEMKSIGRKVHLRLIESRFVNFVVFPGFFDRYLHLNAFLSSRVIPRMGAGTFREYATILVCKYKKDGL